MTELLYYKDPYLREFDATVSSVSSLEGSLRVSTNRTAFYPGGGGQPNDVGWFVAGSEKHRVQSVRKEGNLVWHQVVSDSHPGASTLVQAQEIHGLLDWDRRHLTMRTHTALHILSAVVWRNYRVQVTGGNMDPGSGRMDFEFANLTKELVAEIEKRCNDEVKAAREIRTRSLPRAEALRIPDLIRTKVNLIPESVSEIRTVEIVGLDLQADGGTHVANTREVGQIRIADYKSKGAINKRIYLELT